MTMLYAIADFADQGGGVLWLLFGTCLLLWTLILERALFLRFAWPSQARSAIQQWQQRSDRDSWRALRIREALVSESSMALHAVLPLIRVLVVLCPLLGLLGTVLGMIGVFEVIATSGNDDAQAMARGIYRATIPTMAGLVVALTGIYFTVRLGQLADREAANLQRQLELDGGVA
ncbi:MotA/TolQ/ExbB proton channel family protein [Halioglobus maricola]|uniref:MotA/TolQ/ExbB proton channel family protein n=1 Tax=Halioglobus maricola TaxID=2601894 RepID=A0A5P9NIT5_9GAMM|nr:MotA/TolQ/ExbB proton channel family protein [Halioglobus maricola]QFU75687.1 MotA/TolQ/ExbB proton channel family protein [Halioglobus maricola]